MLNGSKVDWPSLIYTWLVPAMDWRAYLIIAFCGTVFTLADITARYWGERPWSMRFFAMVLIGTIGYAMFGILTQRAEFTTSVIWVSISLTFTSTVYGFLVLGDPVTTNKMAAFVLASVAAYLLSK